MFGCGAEGVLSLLVEIERGKVMDPDVTLGDDPYELVLVHWSVCRAHLSGARRSLRRAAGVDVLTFRTEYLLCQWGQIVDPIGIPVVGLVSRTG